MPYANHHAARLRDPADFDPKSFRTTHGGIIYGRKKVPATIDIIWGKLRGAAKPSDKPVPQSLRFRADKWTVASAKAWLKKQNIHAIAFEPAGAEEKRAAGDDPVREKAEDMVVRAVCEDLECRAPNEEEHSVEFVIATENGVQTPWGREVLRMSGCDLSRFNRNPVVIDSHDRSSINNILGTVDARIDGKQLLGRVYFATDSPKGALAYSLATMKPRPALRAASIGFLRDPKSVVTLAEGETNGEGESKVEGPAMITRKWQLYELSLLPVGADPDAVRREFFAKLKEEERTMAKEKEMQTPDPEEAEEVTSQSPALVPAEPTQPTPEERSLAATEAVKKEILAICPKGLEAVAERAILEGKSVAEARKMLLDEYAKRSPPVGTPEPPTPEKNPQAFGVPTSVEDLGDDLLLRSLTG